MTVLCNEHISFGLEVVVSILSKLILLSLDLNTGNSKLLNLRTVTIFDIRSITLFVSEVVLVASFIICLNSQVL